MNIGTKHKVLRIKSLKIYTPNLAEQVAFYSEVLGLPLLESSLEKASFQIGESLLQLNFREQTSPYHFAINIPSNKAGEALKWLKSRVSVLKDEKTEIHDFDSWKAQAIYFYDLDKNIVEFIARNNLRLNSSEKFGTVSLLSISEIGIPVNDIEKAFNQIHQSAGLEIYDGSFERFCAIGDENGLFICINKNLKTWFPTGDLAYSSDLELTYKSKDQLFTMAFENGEIKVKTFR